MRGYASMLLLPYLALLTAALAVPAVAGTPVPGVTDPNQIVQYSTDGGKSWKSVRSDASGTFYIPVDESPGPHPLILTTGKNGKTIDRSYFNNSFRLKGTEPFLTSGLIVSIMQPCQEQLVL